MVVDFQGKQIKVESGTLLSEVISNSHSLSMPCGGKGTCGKCRVAVSGGVSKPSENEKRLLTLKEFEAGVRLACMTKVVGDVKVSLPDDSINIQENGVLPSFERKPSFSGFAVAIDIGTTTIAAALCNEQSLMATKSVRNSQAMFGADVISRIEKSLGGRGRELSDIVKADIISLIDILLKQENIANEQLTRITITGNTAMLYLLLNEDVTSLSKAPFTAHRLFGESVKANTLQLPYTNAEVYLCRCISAFVGADITTAILASGLLENSVDALIADIGTNGEMAIWSDQKLLCCSTAAGPVFEGAGIQFGMGGGKGAIDHARVENNVILPHVIGDIAAKGICGSGIIDIVSSLLETEMLDETGILESDDEYMGKSAYEIAPEVMITQGDIRMVQLAKSAICAGVKTLISSAEREENQIEKLYVAGGFGSHIDAEKAGKIGLIPKGLSDKVVSLGNAALSGAIMITLSKDCQRKSEEIARLAKTVDLASNPVFSEFYMSEMLF